MPEIGKFYDTGAKQLGTHETGPNYACAAGGVYVITPAKCVELNPATGKQVMVKAIHIHQIVDGRIAALWEEFDMFGLMQQLKEGS